jgi:hypothetical protein
MSPIWGQNSSGESPTSASGYQGECNDWPILSRLLTLMVSSSLGHDLRFRLFDSLHEQLSDAINGFRQRWWPVGN